MVLKVAGYARVSSEDQAQARSIEGQLDYIRFWAKREKWQLIEIYQDNGLSGKNMDRPGLKQLLWESALDKFQAVIVYHNDRLSRDLKDLITIAQDLKNQGVALRCGNLDIDLSSPEGNLMFQLLGGFAEYFRRDLGRKTSLGMQKRKADGLHMGRIGNRFSLVNGRLELQPQYRALAARVLMDHRRGLSLKDIALKQGLGSPVAVYRFIGQLARAGHVDPSKLIDY